VNGAFVEYAIEAKQADCHANIFDYLPVSIVDIDQ